MRLAVKMWAWAALAQIAHLILAAVGLFLDPNLAAEAFQNQPNIPDEIIGPATILSIGLVTTGGIVIMGIVVWRAAQLLKPKAKVRSTRWMLAFFTVFFLLKAMMVFVGSETAEYAPQAVVYVDGVLQILAAVAGLLGLIFVYLDESEAFFTAEPSDKKTHPR